MPAGVDWFFHRIASSQHYSERLHELEWEWTISEVLDAHDVLDAYEEADRLAGDKLRER